MGKVTLEELDALSRVRPLTRLEALKLERAVRRAGNRNEQWHWTRHDENELLRHLLRGRKPKQIALLMHRTEGATWKQMQRMGFSVTRVAKVLLIINDRKVVDCFERLLPIINERDCPIASDDTSGQE